MEQRGVKEGDRQDVLYWEDQCPPSAGLVWGLVWVGVGLGWFVYFFWKRNAMERLQRLQVQFFCHRQERKPKIMLLQAAQLHQCGTGLRGS